MENRAATRTFLRRKRFDTIQFDSIWPDSTLVNRWYKTLEWGILNVVSETIDSIAFRYPIWHMAFFFFLSFQRLEIKWKIYSDILHIQWNWNYWNLQGSGWTLFIWSGNKHLKQIIIVIWIFQIFFLSFIFFFFKITFIIWNILKILKVYHIYICCKKNNVQLKMFFKEMIIYYISTLYRK